MVSTATVPKSPKVAKRVPSSAEGFAVSLPRPKTSADRKGFGSGRFFRFAGAAAILAVPAVLVLSLAAQRIRRYAVVCTGVANVQSSKHRIEGDRLAPPMGRLAKMVPSEFIVGRRTCLAGPILAALSVVLLT